MCRQGSSVIQTAVLDRIRDPALRVYVAWVPILSGDEDAAAQEARSLVPDKRSAHFWDAQSTLPRLFSSVLSLSTHCPAWDVYLAYQAGVTWEEEPPAPLYWQHQLGSVATAPQLDGETFATHLRLIVTNQWEERTND
jgi:hypothetical protein